MCTLKSPTQILVCDVSRDQVRSEVTAAIGDAASFETLHGEGTLVTCLDAGKAVPFRKALQRVLDLPWA